VYLLSLSFTVLFLSKDEKGIEAQLVNKNNCLFKRQKKKISLTEVIDG
jgi:hypothetical protein